ncbi:hypothetical protein IFVP18_C130372 [Vibrio parahaemolyticus]
MKNYISILYPCQYLKWFWGKSVSELTFITPLVLTNPLMKDNG